MQIKKVLFAMFFLLVFEVALGQQEPIRIACVGNSITFGGLGENSYPQQLGKLLGADYEVKNFGVSGRALLKKSDYPYWNEVAFQEAKDFIPQIIIIKLGTNDTKPQNWKYGTEFLNDYVDFINEFKQDSVQPQIFISYPCPVFKTAWGIRDSVVKIIIPIIDEIKQITKTELIDFNAPFLGKPEYFPDGVHPNAAGYLVMAQIAREAVINNSAGIIKSFRSDKDSFDKGEERKLFWETTNGSYVTLDGVEVGEVDSLTINLSESKSFTLISTGNFQADTSTITIAYNPPGKIKYFYSKPRMIELGSNDSSAIYWSTAKESNVFLDELLVDENGTKIVKPILTTNYKLESSGEISEIMEILVQVLPGNQINRALDNYIKSSSFEENHPAGFANDDDTLTYWKSKNDAWSWIYLDFGKNIIFERVVLNWGNNFAISYELQVANASGSPKTIFTQENGKGGVEEIANLSASGKYLRLLCKSRTIPDSGCMLNEIEIYGETQITSLESETNLISEFRLFQNYPNPFNPTTKIKYSLPIQTNVKLNIYDVLGKEIITLVNKEMIAGNYEVVFNASELSSGLYFYTLKTDSFVSSKKMMLVK